MSRIINPYNVVPFYRSLSDAQKHCPLYAPPTGLAWQFNNGDALSSYSAALVNASTGVEISIASGNVTNQYRDDDGSSYLTYKLGGLASTPDEGLYYYKITAEAAEFFSNYICIENVFSSQTWGASTSCTGSAGSFTRSIQFVGTVPGIASVEADTGTGYTYLGTTSGALDQDDFGSGEQTVRFRLTSSQGEVIWWKEYTLVFDTSDPCTNISFGQTGQGGANVDAVGYIQFYNSTDLDGLGLLYQDDYRQRFYFKREDAFPVPIEEYTFIENGQGEQLFESLSIAEQVNFDIYPVPDHMLTVLSSIRAHDNVVIVSRVDTVSTIPKNLTITPRQVDGSLCSAVQVSYEANRSYIPGCNENITLQVAE